LQQYVLGISHLRYICFFIWTANAKNANIELTWMNKTVSLCHGMLGAFGTDGQAKFSIMALIGREKSQRNLEGSLDAGFSAQILAVANCMASMSSLSQLSATASLMPIACSIFYPQ
jgi:hypothetical protein